jgi:hypothetical protein
MNLAERQQRVRDLEAEVARFRARVEAQRARYEAVSRAIQNATSIYIDTITAPIRALAEDLRR